MLAFALSWFIQERTLRETVTTDGVGEAFAAPRPPDSLREIARALSQLAGRDRTRALHRRGRGATPASS